MADQHPWDDLHRLAQSAEDIARPLPAERVRRLGDRRRTRRQVGLSAAALAVVAAVSGIVLGQNGLGADPVPDPAQTPSVVTASPTPVRTVTAANLISAAEVPSLAAERFVQTALDAGRDDQHASICLPDGGLAGLAVQEQQTRNFRLARRAGGETNNPQPPFGNDPTIYTQALQFSSVQDAQAAYTALRGWVDDCATTIKSRKAVPLGAAGKWFAVKTAVPGAQAGFTELTWREGSDTSGNGYFESVGIAQVGDRLALVVSLQYGQDYNGVAYDQAGDPDLGLPPHPQFGLLVAAAAALQR